MSDLVLTEAQEALRSALEHPAKHSREDFVQLAERTGETGIDAGRSRDEVIEDVAARLDRQIKAAKKAARDAKRAAAATEGDNGADGEDDGTDGDGDGDEVTGASSSTTTETATSADVPRGTPTPAELMGPPGRAMSKPAVNPFATAHPVPSPGPSGGGAAPAAPAAPPGAIAAARNAAPPALQATAAPPQVSITPAGGLPHAGQPIVSSHGLRMMGTAPAAQFNLGDASVPPVPPRGAVAGAGGAAFAATAGGAVPQPPPGATGAPPGMPTFAAVSSGPQPAPKPADELARVTDEHLAALKETLVASGRADLVVDGVDDFRKWLKKKLREPVAVERDES